MLLFFFLSCFTYLTEDGEKSTRDSVTSNLFLKVLTCKTSDNVRAISISKHIFFNNL